jgi:hypothetical protein
MSFKNVNGKPYMYICQKLMLPLFKLMKFTSQTHENFTELYYNIAESSAIFNAPSMFVKSSPNFEQKHVFCALYFLCVWQSTVPHHPHTGILTSCL